MFDPNTVLIAGSLLLAVISMLASAVWTVSNIRATTAVLNVTIEHLKESIDRLFSMRCDDSLAIKDLEHRLTVLEGR